VGVAGGGKSQPPAGFGVLLALDHQDRFAARDRVADLVDAVQQAGGIGAGGALFPFTLAVLVLPEEPAAGMAHLTQALAVVVMRPLPALAVTAGRAAFRAGPAAVITAPFHPLAADADPQASELLVV
jgi:hypothetical protein